MKTTGGEKTFSQYKEHPSIIPLEKRDEKCFPTLTLSPDFHLFWCLKPSKYRHSYL